MTKKRVSNILDRSWVSRQDVDGEAGISASSQLDRKIDHALDREDYVIDNLRR